MTENNFNGMTVAEGVAQLESNFNNHFGDESSATKERIKEEGFNILQLIEGLPLGGITFIPFIEDDLPLIEVEGGITYFSWVALVITGWMESLDK
tara:strand:+ start:3310 stop:3594 length:285 start_codon:yes stop_codon:yes gene_type:complete